MDHRRLICYQAIIEHDMLYMVPDNCNAICRLDLNSREVSIVEWLDDIGNMDYLRYFYSVLKKEQRIIAIPGRSDQFILCDLMGDKEYIDIPEPFIECDISYSKDDKFFGGIVYGDNFFVIGAAYPAVIRVDGNTGKAFFITDGLIDMNSSENKCNNRYIFSHGHCICGECAYIPSGLSASIYKLNLCDDYIEAFDNVPDSVTMIHGITHLNNELWLLATTNLGLELMKWNVSEGVTEGVIIETSQAGMTYWWNPIIIDGVAFIFQSNGDAVYRVNLELMEAEKLSKISEAMQMNQGQCGRYLIRLMGCQGKSIYYSTSWNRKWFVYDSENDSIESFYVEIKDDEYEKRYWYDQISLLGEKGMIEESEFSLEPFIRVL